MKRIILFLLLIMPLSAFAENGPWRYYIGLHGNISRSTVHDGNSWLIGRVLGMNDIDTRMGRPGALRIDNGDIQSNPSFSITVGMEQRRDHWDSRNIKLLIGGELFFDHINHTVVQGNQTWQNDMQFGSFINHRRNAGEPIHRTNFLAGARGKLGLNFFDRFDIYGHAGLTYWDRSYYLFEDKSSPYWGGIEGLQTLPVLPFIGIGAKFHITNNWAINANYMTVLPALYDAAADRYGIGYRFANARASVGMDIFTLGILYYF